MMRERTVNVARRCLMLRCAGGVLKTTRPARLVIPCQSLDNCFTAYFGLPREIFAAPVQLESLRGLASDCRCQGRGTSAKDIRVRRSVGWPLVQLDLISANLHHVRRGLTATAQSAKARGGPMRENNRTHCYGRSACTCVDTGQRGA